MICRSALPRQASSPCLGFGAKTPLVPLSPQSWSRMQLSQTAPSFMLAKGESLTGLGARRPAAEPESCVQLSIAPNSLLACILACRFVSMTGYSMEEVLGHNWCVLQPNYSCLLPRSRQRSRSTWPLPAAA